AHRMAAELIAAGVEPQVIHQKLYEGLPFSRIQLLARALAKVQRFDGGALTLTHLTRDDFAHSDADESDAEGIVDHMRQVEGTLAPFATGLLLLLIGRATRAQRFFMALSKTYRAVARLGWTSDTGDPDGELTHTGRVPERLEMPTGELMQRPPPYSAVKLAGERLHRRTRRGEIVEAEPRPV